MVRKTGIFAVLLALLGLMAIGPTAAQGDPFVFGMILVGPQNDQGWSQAHYEAGKYVEEQLKEAGIDARMIVFENLNPVVNPQTTLLAVVANMVDEGAVLVITTSDEFEPDTVAAAEEFPDIAFIHVSGSAAQPVKPVDLFPAFYQGGEALVAPPNLTNLMGEMEFGKAIAGCAAALTTKTGSVSYLGPLINAETRRFVAAAYLGAKYCYENYRGMEPGSLAFDVVWIGFWVPTPFTLDPTQVTNSFFDRGSDVVISGIDPQDALRVAGQRRGQGDDVYAIPYDYELACDTAPEACLGIPYFHWGPDYLELVQKVINGTFTNEWLWIGPDWSAEDPLEGTMIGWDNGPALSEEAAADLEAFIAEMTAYQLENPDKFFLWDGPLNFQDGTSLVGEGENVDPLAIWYLPRLLEGIVGDSVISE